MLVSSGPEMDSESLKSRSGSCRSWDGSGLCSATCPWPVGFWLVHGAKGGLLVDFIWAPAAGWPNGLSCGRPQMSAFLAPAAARGASYGHARGLGVAATSSSPQAPGSASEHWGRLWLVGLVASAFSLRPSNGTGRGGRIVVRGRNYETNIKKKKGPAERRMAQITAKHLRWGWVHLRYRWFTKKIHLKYHLIRSSNVFLHLLPSRLKGNCLFTTKKKHISSPGGDSTPQVDCGRDEGRWSWPFGEQPTELRPHFSFFNLYNIYIYNILA